MVWVDDATDENNDLDSTENMDELLARGGWELVDPQPIAAEHPDTFELPDAAQLASLAPGSMVRASFRVATIADAARDGLSPYDAEGRPVLVSMVERMWAIVLDVDSETVDAVLTNQPYGTHTSLEIHTRLRIPLTHLIAVGDPIDDLPDFLVFLERWESDGPPNDPSCAVDPAAPPRIRRDQQEVCDRAGVRAEPPNPFSLALLAKDVSVESSPVHGARFEPRPERGDSGWVFFAGDTDFDEVAERVGFDVVRLQEAHGRSPAIWPHVALPPGWGFTAAGGHDEDAGESDVYAIEWAD